MNQRIPSQLPFISSSHDYHSYTLFPSLWSNAPSIHHVYCISHLLLLKTRLKLGSAMRMDGCGKYDPYYTSHYRPVFLRRNTWFSEPGACDIFLTSLQRVNVLHKASKVKLELTNNICDRRHLFGLKTVSGCRQKCSVSQALMVFLFLLSK